MLYVDESQDISYEWISKQAQPFLASTGGIFLTTGTSNNSKDSALYNYYKSEAIPQENKIILDWKKIYKYKKYISDEHAEKYKITVESEIKEKGLHSKVIQTEWFCNFNVNTDGFIIKDDMYNNNMFEGQIEDNISNYEDKDIYRIGSLDPALSEDRCAFTYGISGFSEDMTWTKIKGFEIIKDLGDTIKPSKIISEAIRLCKQHKLDYLIIDNTAGQKYLTSPLYEKLILETKTQLIPFDYSGRAEKVKMCKYNDALVLQQNVKLPLEKFALQNEGFKITIDEITSLTKKKNSNGGYSYEAFSGFHDDFAMSYMMINYALNYASNSIADNKRFKIGDVLLRLYIKKWTEDKPQAPKKKSIFWRKV